MRCKLWTAFSKQPNEPAYRPGPKADLKTGQASELNLWTCYLAGFMSPLFITRSDFNPTKSDFWIREILSGECSCKAMICLSQTPTRNFISKHNSHGLMILDELEYRRPNQKGDYLKTISMKICVSWSPYFGYNEPSGIKTLIRNIFVSRRLSFTWDTESKRAGMKNIEPVPPKAKRRMDFC